MVFFTCMEVLKHEYVDPTLNNCDVADYIIILYNNIYIYICIHVINNCD